MISIDPRGVNTHRFRLITAIVLGAGAILGLLAGVPLQNAWAQEEESGDRQQTAEPLRVEEVVVTATRIEMPVKQVASSVTVITAEEIKRRQATDVVDVLRGVPGLDVVRTAGASGLASVFIRGAKSEHTLVMIDGIVINDPISPGRATNFADLSVANIERIEVIRGPQSVLYGSNAIGGVINIITKRGRGAPEYYLSGEAGSFNTTNAGAGVSGGEGIMNYSVGVARFYTAGFSAADDDLKGNSERDGYARTTISARVGFTPAENYEIDFFARAMDSETELDLGGGAGNDDPNFDNRARQRFYRVQGRLFLVDGLWEQKLGYSVSEHRTVSRNKTDGDHPDDSSRSVLDGSIQKIDWQHNLFLGDVHTVTLGLENQEERGKSEFTSVSAFGTFTSDFDEQSATTLSYYLQDAIQSGETFFATIGARVDDHELFGQHTTYRVTAAYFIGASQTRLKATYGTGFNAPTLFQLFSEFGNEDLDPESSVGWDAGVEQGLLDGALALGVTYFSNTFEDLIDFDFGTNSFINVDEAETSGYEVDAAVRPGDDLDINLTYTQTETEDKETGKRLLRRANEQYAADTSYRLTGRTLLGLTVLHVGERVDVEFLPDFTSQRVQLDPYTLVQVGGSYAARDNLNVFARVENLFDEDYEEVKGFGTPPRAVYAGFQATF
ncbi:MAG: TonB-dependent receptor [SAR324 cluster bacterium]|nr:TonB-dependent receptor [SAR324 cluster bacterium]